MASASPKTSVTSTAFSAFSVVTSNWHALKSRAKRVGAQDASGTGHRPLESFFWLWGFFAPDSSVSITVPSSVGSFGSPASSTSTSAVFGFVTGSGASVPFVISSAKTRASSFAICARRTNASSMTRGSCAARIFGSSRTPPGRSKSRARNESARSLRYVSYFCSASAGVVVSETCRTQNSRNESGPSSSLPVPFPLPRPPRAPPPPTGRPFPLSNRWSKPGGGPSNRRRRGERSCPGSRS
mmetsp:Transcript_6466/g.24394  ORF Transcript_6466/g.24394 Transcript_6466/m.24394 type:complete len:241 (-) Transcript_6466:327-1049(-)